MLAASTANLSRPRRKLLRFCTLQNHQEAEVGDIPLRSWIWGCPTKIDKWVLKTGYLPLFFYFSTKMTKYYIWYTLFSNKPIHISYKNGYTSQLFPTVSLYWLRNFQFSFPQPIPIRSFSMGQNLVPLLFTSKMLVCYGYSSL